MRTIALLVLGTLAASTAITLAQHAAAVPSESPDVVLKAAMNRELVDGDIAAAIQRYREIVTRFRVAAPAVAARALVLMGASYERLGSVESRKTYEEIIRDFSDQREAVATARAKLDTVAGHERRTPRLTTQRVLEVAGHWDRISPDGRYVARPESKSGNLVLYDLRTGISRPLTPDGSPEDPDHRFPLASAFSRDGRQIAYEWYLEIKNQSILRVVGTEEGSSRMPRTMYDNPDADVSPMDWSPDGRWIAVMVTRKDRTKQIGIVAAADGSLRILKTVDWSRVGGLRFSPDSSMLAYHRPPREGALDRDVFVIALDGSRETALAPSPADDIVLEWAPDGQRLLIASDRGGSNSMWSVGMSGHVSTSVDLVKSDVGIISSLGPTRDGTLFYNLVPATPGIYTATFDTASGQLAPASVQALQEFNGFAFFPQFVDDGTSLAYVSRRDVSATLGNVFMMVSTDTGAVRDVRPALAYGNFPHWFPDGRHIIVYGLDLKGRPGVFKLDAAAGTIALTVPRDTCNLPFLAADGQSIFCHWPKEKQLRQLDATTGELVRTVTLDGQPYAASPDGRYVVTSALNIVELATGESRLLMRLSPPATQVGNSFTICWTPDSRSVTFYGRINGDEGMWRVPIDGGAPQKINVNVGTILSWRINAKTGQVAFSTNGVGPRLEMWKMENFLSAK
jgi:Tol biopolymer transport system component